MNYQRLDQRSIKKGDGDDAEVRGSKPAQLQLMDGRKNQEYGTCDTTNMAVLLARNCHQASQ
jgi:hypothetical protein